MRNLAAHSRALGEDATRYRDQLGEVVRSLCDPAPAALRLVLSSYYGRMLINCFGDQPQLCGNAPLADNERSSLRLVSQLEQVRTECAGSLSRVVLRGRSSPTSFRRHRGVRIAHLGR
jgi:hypothetical protein